jgi:hypothetical protein
MKTKKNDQHIAAGQALAAWCFLIGVIAVVGIAGIVVDHVCG